MATTQAPGETAVRDPRQEIEKRTETSSSKLNWLRAAVLGANDGIVSVAGLVMGVAGATRDSTSILVAGIAGLAAGALSMGAGEYVSVSTQRDAERAMIQREIKELEDDPEGELEELAGYYEAKGLSPELSLQVAQELTARNPLAAHAEVELGIDPDDLTNPWHAAWASMVAFTLGALIPLIQILFAPPSLRIGATVVTVAVALAVTGYVSAKLGRSGRGAAVLRNVCGGMLAMAVTYGIGAMVGTGV